MAEKLYTVEQIAEITQQHRNTVRRWIRRGDLAAIRMGKGYRIRQSALDDFIRKRETSTHQDH